MGKVLEFPSLFQDAEFIVRAALTNALGIFSTENFLQKKQKTK